MLVEEKKANPLLHFTLSKSLFYLKYTEKIYLHMKRNVHYISNGPLEETLTFIRHFQIPGLGVRP